MKKIHTSQNRFLLFLAIIYSFSTISYSQNCPSLPGGHYIGSFGSSSQEYLFPGTVPSGSPSGSQGGKTIGHLYFEGKNITYANRRLITIRPTLDGSSYGKVLLQLFKLRFNSGTYLKIYRGSNESGTLVDEITSSNYASKVGDEYIIDGAATLVFYGQTPNVADNNIIRFLTGDILIQTCNEGRSGLVWKDFISANSYVLVDDQEGPLNPDGSTSYPNFLPACMAYFDENKNFVRVETAFCIDQLKDAPTPGYWEYPGEYQFSIHSTTNYDIDRDGFNASKDNLKIARILWLISQAEGKTFEIKGDIQWGIWDTQYYSVTTNFSSSSWAAKAKSAVPTIPSPVEPTFSMNFPSDETGEDVVNTGTIQVDIPFSWSSVQTGQTKVVKLIIPAGIAVQSVTGGTLSGSNLTITAAVATLTLSSSVIGEFTIKAVYDDPFYCNVSNLKVYKPCNASPQSQEFLHVGEENLARPFRSILVKWVQNPLPVRLMSFDASLENKNAVLQWNSAEEVNFSHYIIEKSTDAEKWSSISMVSSNSTGNYQFVDSNISSMTTFYYRLKMVDHDDTYSYSRIQNISFDQKGLKLILHPNPASDFIFLKDADGQTLASDKVAALSIMNTQGAEVYKLTSPVSSDGINVTNLTSGMYVIKITLTDGTLSTHKLVVGR
ncbi:putative secreted protein (Por secretion system target) [Dyadobacter jejuensis]|uniref:Putative secreted protein (Por secretion system target) n=1 Tax=Dyadobacter jejuensis TaxID=1082580 RepID=A0A316AHH8_9BACT|nr:T9SS type A sorting domain-containing protein [Dyadobacter jejuensis]PWJ57091.1 putative secreted protein (Por secretion system target) [Dyadobacter jejuensis]